MTDLIRRANARSLRIVDLVIVSSVLLWLAFSWWVALSLWDLSELGVTVAQSGRTLDHAGRTMQDAGGIPLVGDQIERLGTQVRDTAAAITAQATDLQLLVRRLSVLIGVAVALILLAPLLVGYLPARLLRMRDTRAIRRALSDPGFTRGLERYLAHRAIASFSLSRLHELTEDPLLDVCNGRSQRLAEAELARLGLDHRAQSGGRGRGGQRAAAGPA